MLSHQENHAKWKISADSQKTSVQQLNEQLEKAKLELEEAQDTVSSLHQQVQDRNEVIEATNEALLIKVSKHIEAYTAYVNVRISEPVENFYKIHLSQIEDIPKSKISTD